MSRPATRASLIDMLNLPDESFTGIHWNLRGVDLSGAILDWMNLRGVDFTDANLEGASLENANISKAIFTKANLIGCRFDRAKATDAVFDGAIMDKNGTPIVDEITVQKNAAREASRRAKHDRNQVKNGNGKGNGNGAGNGNGDQARAAKFAPSSVTADPEYLEMMRHWDKAVSRNSSGTTGD